MTGVTFVVVQWFKLCTPNSQGAGSIPGWGTKILYAAQHGQKINNKILENCII